MKVISGSALDHPNHFHTQGNILFDLAQERLADEA